MHRFSGENIAEIAFESLNALTESEVRSDLKEAIANRLSFHNDALEILLQHSAGQSPPESLFRFMHDSLDKQQKSHRLGKEVREAFSTKLQRRLASTVPPRPMVTVSMDQAWSFWHSMLADCKNVFAVHLAQHSQDLFTAYEIFAYASPQLSTYPRALLQSFLSYNELIASRLAAKQFLEEDLRSLTLPASDLLSLRDGSRSKLSSDDLKAGECLQAFFDKFEFNFINVYRALCLNNCRIRRTFCHALLEWDALQSQIEELDSVIQETTREQPTVYLPGSPPTFSFKLSSWVYHHKLNMLRLTIQMGFEQMIYAPHELVGMYWYLSSVCDVHLSHLERISHFITTKDTEVKQTKMSSIMKEEAIAQCKMALDRLYQQYAWIKATQLLAGTLHLIFNILQRCRILVSQQPVYSADMLRYEIRMKPFLGISIPELLNHEDFCREVQLQQLTLEELLKQATMMSAEAKRAWEAVARTSWNIYTKLSYESEPRSILDEKWNQGVKDCLKTAIGASLCVLTLRQTVANEKWQSKARKETKIPRPGEKGRWHQWWVVPALPTL